MATLAEKARKMAVDLDPTIGDVQQIVKLFAEIHDILKAQPIPPGGAAFSWQRSIDAFNIRGWKISGWGKYVLSDGACSVVLHVCKASLYRGK